MRKQIDGQISLFDYMAEEEQKLSRRSASKRKRISQSKAEREQRQDSGSTTQSTARAECPADVTPISLFEQCAVCWCSDCIHNERLDAVPRDFAGTKKACPSCSFCLQKKKAEICEIGSYDNGCRLRASEEGIEP